MSPASGLGDGALASAERRNPVVRLFGAFPTITSTALAAVTVGWIALGTVVASPLAGSATEDFVRDGVVRWPGAVVLLATLWFCRRHFAADLTGRPQRPTWFPWATIVLGVVALLRLSVVSQFWSDGTYTVATFFSELSTGVIEELAFRGLIFGGLVFGFGQTEWGVRKAAVLTTVLFGLSHITSGWAAALVTLLFGAVFLTSALELRSLWPVAVLHGFFDVGVNGGSAAGEGEWQPTLMGFASVALLLAGAVALLLLFRWSRYPVEPADTGSSYL